MNTFPITSQRIWLVETDDTGILSYKRVTVGKKPLTIGRDPKNRLQIAAPEVSSIHAEIKREFLQDKDEVRTAFVLQDKGSRNGTYLNGERVSDPQKTSGWIILREGDVIRFASVARFTVQSTDDDNQQKITEVQSTIQGLEPYRSKLKLRSRYFINSGKFDLIRPKKKNVACRVILFDDMILWAKEKKKNQFVFTGNFAMKSVRVINTDEPPNAINILNKNNGVSITIATTTPEAKDLWMKEFKRVIHEWLINNLNEMQIENNTDSKEEKKEKKNSKSKIENVAYTYNTSGHSPSASPNSSAASFLVPSTSSSTPPPTPTSRSFLNSSPTPSPTASPSPSPSPFTASPISAASSGSFLATTPPHFEYHMALHGELAKKSVEASFVSPSEVASNGPKRTVSPSQPPPKSLSPPPLPTTPKPAPAPYPPPIIPTRNRSSPNAPNTNQPDQRVTPTNNGHNMGPRPMSQQPPPTAQRPIAVKRANSAHNMYSQPQYQQQQQMQQPQYQQQQPVKMSSAPMVPSRAGSLRRIPVEVNQLPPPPPVPDTGDDAPPVPPPRKATSGSLDTSKTIKSFAIYDYFAIDSDDLSFKKGDCVFVLETDESGWWKGICNNKLGLFPQNFVKLEGEVDQKSRSQILRQHQLLKEEPKREPEEVKYSYAVLSNPNTLPADVDKDNLEKYLDDREFKTVFGMTPKEFSTLPLWKRSAIKNQKNLTLRG